MIEDELVGKISGGFGSWRGASSSIRLGIGDDAALFRHQPGHDTILTCDWFLEGTHFVRGKHPPDSVGWKCLARAVSDIAAMGGRPRCFLLSLALPVSLAGRWLDAFRGGLRRASRKFHCVLAGGDTTRCDKILINVTVVGEAPTGQAVLRSSARPGDFIYVSGRLGEAEFGLRILKRSSGPPNTKDPRVKKHLYPEPRLALGQWLATKGFASAMMDISDGLSSDLPRLCAASSVGAQVETAKVPTLRTLDRNRDRRNDRLELALHGGDDYELLFTVRPEKVRNLPRSFAGVPLSRIGATTLEKKVVLVDERSREQPFNPGGWDPFRRAR